MSSPVKSPAWPILAAALLVGVTGDVLLRGGMWRAGFALWIAGIAVCVLVLGGRATPQRRLLLGGAVLAAIGMVWRDAPMLYAVDLLSVLCMGALTVWHGSGESLGRLTVIESIRAAVLAVVNALGGAAGVTRQLGTERGHQSAGTGRARALTIGVLIALPPLVIVTSLLASSDAVFDGLLERVGRFLANDVIQHVVAALVLAWLAAGWLRAALGDALRVPVSKVRSPGLPFMSVGVGLYALIALLVLFLATQARVLFGGEAFLLATQGLTVAAYAREGFFQLVVAAGVVMVTLVAADWLLPSDDPHGRRRYRVAGTTLLALVAALLVSAVVRLWLYVNEFGLSVDRAFAVAVMVWVVAALVAFAGTTLRGRSDRFAPVTLFATIGWVALLNIVNPEAIVVRVNVARAEAGQSFDAKYHAGLSADALPTLLSAAPRLNAADCTALSDALKKSWSVRLAHPEDGGRDWRSRNLPLVRAREWYEAGASTCTGAPATPPADRSP